MEVPKDESLRDTRMKQYPFYIQPLLPFTMEDFTWPEECPVGFSGGSLEVLREFKKYYPDYSLKCSLLPNGNLYITNLIAEGLSLKENLKKFKVLSSLFSSDYVYFLNTFKVEDLEDKEHYIECFKKQGFDKYIVEYEEF